MSFLRTFRDATTRIRHLQVARAALAASANVQGRLASSAPINTTSTPAGGGFQLLAANYELSHVQSARCSSLGWRAHSQLQQLQQQAHMTTSTKHREDAPEPLLEEAQSSPEAAHAAPDESKPPRANDQRPIDELVAEVFSCAEAKSQARHESPLQALAECLVSRANELTSKQIRDLTVEFSKRHFFNTEFRGAISRAMRDRLHEFEPHHVADTALAFAEAGYYDYELFMKVLVPHLRDHAHRYDAGSLAKLLSAFTRFGLNDDVLVDLMDEVTVKLNSQEGSKAIAEVVFAEARMGWADERVQNLAAYYAAEHIQDFDAETVSKLMYGLIALGYEDEALLALLVGRAKELAQLLGPEDVTRMMWAVGELGYFDDHFLDAMVDLVAGAPEAYNAAQLGSIVTACNKLGYNSPGVATAAHRLGQAHGTPTFAA